MSTLAALSTVTFASPPSIELRPLPRPSSSPQTSFQLGRPPSLQHDSPAAAAPTAEVERRLTTREVCIIISLTAVTFVCSISSGLVTVAMPAIQVELGLDPSLILWPGAVYSLAMGCCLMLVGAVADLVGNRHIQLVGSVVLVAAMTACGRAENGAAFILFRAMQGLGAAMCFPTSTSIVTTTFPQGRSRNLAFSCLGLGQPLGFQVGLSLGGVFVDSYLSWRFGFYLCAGTTAGFFAMACYTLPKDRPRERLTAARLARDIDWVGVLLSSACFGLFSYFLALVTGSTSAVHQAGNIAILVVAVLLAPAFVLWMHVREKQGKAALIPNSIWKKATFSTICAMVLLVWAVLNSMEYVLSLYYQQIQHVSALQASLRFLPNILWGVILNVLTGQIVHRLPTNWFVVTMAMLSTIAPLLLAVNNPDWSWWTCLFWGALLGPSSADVIFTVANLIVTDVFPPHTQAVAGAVFNTVSQLGNAVGLAVVAVISRAVADEKGGSAGADSAQALLQGYVAAFWTMFGWMILATVIGVVGLRRIGRIGVKRD